MSSFADRQLRVTLILAGGNSVFPGTNKNTLILSNMRISVKVQSVARLATQAQVRIYGMSAADMNALTVAWSNPPIVLNHIVKVEANSGSGWSQIFTGTIIEAQPEYRAAPDVYFELAASVGYFQQISAAPPTSYKGATPIATIVAALAEQMGFTFKDGGAVGVLNNPYLAGTLFDQLRQACGATNTDYYLQQGTGAGSAQDNPGTILITQAQKPGSADTSPAVVLSKDTGLIGYPVYERAGLNVAAIFDPIFLCGTALQIQSTVPNATGRWYPYSLTHDLESRTPKGQWLSHMKCLRVFV